MLANLTPQSADLLDEIQNVLKAVKDPNFLKNCAAELKKVQKAKRDLAKREKDILDREKAAETALSEATALKKDMEAEISALADREKAIAEGDAGLKTFRKMFEIEKRDFMNDLNAKMADLDLRDKDLKKLTATAKREMARVKSLEASLKPKLDLIEKLRA